MSNMLNEPSETIHGVYFLSTSKKKVDALKKTIKYLVRTRKGPTSTILSQIVSKNFNPIWWSLDRVSGYSDRKSNEGREASDGMGRASARATDSESR
jgi:hypothetical protein